MNSSTRMLVSRAVLSKGRPTSNSSVWQVARSAIVQLKLLLTIVSQAKLWDNAIVQATLLPMLAVQLKRIFDTILRIATDQVFTQVRFQEDAELRHYISHKLQNSRAGFRVSTLDDEHGAAEVLRSNNIDLFSYTLNTHGAAPLHVTHMPLKSESSWLWLSNEKYAPWWTLPIVWICPENIDSPFWSSLPKFVKDMIMSAVSTIRRFMALPAESQGSSHKSHNLVVSTFRWHASLIDTVANEAARFGEQNRTRSCPILHLRSDGVRTIVAPPRQMSTVVLGAEGDALLADIALFFGSREWYRANDLPYQRIYLLHGPPGNGKSSFLQALAILFSMPFFYLELANKQLTLEGLRNMLRDNTLQSRCILALEDAESVFKQTTPEAEAAEAEKEAERLERLFAQSQQNGGDKNNASNAAMAAHYGVTIEDFTALIGGDLSPPNGRLIFFTTNHVDRMHSDLVRLVDEQGMRVHFPNPDCGVIEGMWRCFYAQMADRRDASWEHFQKEYSRQFGADARICSGAAVQEYLMRYRTEPETASEPISVARLKPITEERHNSQAHEASDPAVSTSEVAQQRSSEKTQAPLEIKAQFDEESSPRQPVAREVVLVSTCCAIVCFAAALKRSKSHNAKLQQKLPLLLRVFFDSLRGLRGRLPQAIAFAISASAWMGLSGLITFVNRALWASYSLPVGKDEEAGTWVLDVLRAQLARGAERFDALPKTDQERLGSAVRTIELKSSRFKELSTQHVPLEPTIEHGRAYRLRLPVDKDVGEGSDERFVWITVYQNWLSLRLLLGYGGWLPRPSFAAAGMVASHRIAQRVVEYSRQAFSTARSRHTNVYRFSVRHQKWVKETPPPERLRQASFISPCDIPADAEAQEALAADTCEFFTLRQWYRERGIPYRRGYMLHGSKGCGKQYFVRRLAAAAGVPIYILDIGKSSTMTNETLPAHLHAVEANAIVVLKNVDAFVGNRSMAGVSKELTFSGLLNVLDGALGANKGLIMVLTTNRFQRLQRDSQSADALLRPGRVSKMAHFGNPSVEQLSTYFSRLFLPREKIPHHNDLSKEVGIYDLPWLSHAAKLFITALQTEFPHGCTIADESCDANPSMTWRCPWNFQEVKGLLMQPVAKQIVQLSESTTTCNNESGVLHGWELLLADFKRHVQATRRAILCKTLEQHSSVLKRELRRPADVDADRQERERGADDAETLLLELSHPALGLHSTELLAKEPALRRVVEHVRDQVRRLRDGEVELEGDSKPVTCPHCKMQLTKCVMRGHYCDTANCGAPPSYRCPSRTCDFDLCQNCYDLAQL